MAQPEYVPVTDRDRVRVSERLPTPPRWAYDRPGEVRQDGAQPRGDRFGVAGPDQGYALRLAEQMSPELEVQPGEHREDAVVGCVAVATKRAAVFGRAPVKADLDLAFTLWGFLGGAPDELLALRRRLFEGVAHHYNDRRAVADRVPEATLRLTPADVRARLAGEWRTLLND